MECSVCYCDSANCSLVCGHSFCFSCVKEWYHKTETPTCPMCRRNLYFKGLRRLEEKWTADAIEQENDDMFGRFFEETLEDFEDEFEDSFFTDMAMVLIKEGQERLQRIANLGYEREIVEHVVYDNVTLVTSNGPTEYNEPKTFTQTLFVNKKPIRKEYPMTRCREHVDYLGDCARALLMS